VKIGEKIKQRRIELGWSQRELGKRMGYQNHSTITKIEAGKVDIPQSKVVKFAEVMGTSIAYLMDWEEVQKKNNATADIVLRLNSDNEFFSAVEVISKLSPEQLASIKQMANLLLKG
jgi:transcriptional regulator with XRE-family HTH domain